MLCLEIQLRERDGEEKDGRKGSQVVEIKLYPFVLRKTNKQKQKSQFDS